ncbi:MAG: hypothetical protein PHQ32_02200 [Firmicutes bacterium]|nr:hypothetical protein [Bacillota bacterium]
MKNKIYVIITTLLIFIFLGTGISRYYIEYKKLIINDDKYIKREITWVDFSKSDVESIIKVENKLNNKYDKYKLVDINYDDIKTEYKEITKIVRYNNIKSKYDTKISEIIASDNNTLLFKANTTIKPVYEDVLSWHENLISFEKIYYNLKEADLINIPKVVNYKGYNWYMLSDKINFTSNNINYICALPYYRIDKSIVSKRIVNSYNIDVIYKGKLAFKSGKVHLKYKIENKEEVKILSKSNLKIIIFIISIGTILLISLNLIKNKKEHL